MSLMMLAERFVVAVESLAKSHAAIAKALTEGTVSLKQLGLPADGRVFAGSHPAHAAPYKEFSPEDVEAKLAASIAAVNASPANKPVEPPKPKKLSHDDVRLALINGMMAWPRDPPDSKQAAPWAADQLRAVVTGRVGPNTTKITEIKEEFFPVAMRYASALDAIGKFASASGVPAALEVLSKSCAGATGFAAVAPEHLDGLLAALRPE